MLQDVGGQGFDQPFAMNGTDESVGYSAIPDGYEAVLWSSSGTATVFKDIGGQSFSIALAVNASGDSVGYSDTASGSTEAVLWSPDGERNKPRPPCSGPPGATPRPWGSTKPAILSGLATTRARLRRFSARRSRHARARELSTWAMLVAGFIGLGFAGRRRAAKHWVVVETAWRSSGDTLRQTFFGLSNRQNAG